MGTRALTIHVAPEAAQAYETATPEVRRQVDELLSHKLREAMRELNRQGDSLPKPKDVWDVVLELRAKQERDPVDINPDEVFADVRDPSPGREFSW